MAGGFKGEEHRPVYNPEDTQERMNTRFIENLDAGKKAELFEMQVDPAALPDIKEAILDRGFAIATDRDGGQYFLNKSDAMWRETIYVKPGSIPQFGENAALKYDRQRNSDGSEYFVLYNYLVRGNHYVAFKREDLEFLTDTHGEDEEGRHTMFDAKKYEELVEKIIETCDKLEGITVMSQGRKISLDGNTLKFDASKQPSNSFAGRFVDLARGNVWNPDPAKNKNLNRNFKVINAKFAEGKAAE